MYAQLGNIVFERLVSPDSLQFRQTEKYSVIALATGKPRLQRVGTELDEVSFTIRFHASFCVPADQLEALRAARQNAEILPFTTGVGELLGRYVISQIGTTRTQLGPNGELIEATADVTLLEFYDPNEQATDEAEAQRRAFANDRRKVVPVQPIAARPLPSAVVSQEARASVSHNAQAITEAKKAQASTAETASRLRRAQQQIEAARDNVDRVIGILQDQIALANAAPEMLGAAQAAAAYIPTVLQAIASGDAAGAFSNTTALGALLDSMVRKGINIETGILQRKL